MVLNANLVLELKDVTPAIKALRVLALLFSQRQMASKSAKVKQ